MENLKDKEKKLVLLSIIITIIFLIWLVLSIVWLDGLSPVVAQNPVKKEQQLMQDTIKMDTVPLRKQMKILKEQSIKQKIRVDSIIKNKKKE